MAGLSVQMKGGRQLVSSGRVVKLQIFHCI